MKKKRVARSPSDGAGASRSTSRTAARERRSPPGKKHCSPHHRQNLVGISREWSEGEGKGERGDDDRKEASLYTPWISRQRVGARNFHHSRTSPRELPAVARIAPKSAARASRGAELPSYEIFSRRSGARQRWRFWPSQARPRGGKVEPNAWMGSQERSRAHMPPYQTRPRRPRRPRRTTKTCQVHAHL